MDIRSKEFQNLVSDVKEFLSEDASLLEEGKQIKLKQLEDKLMKEFGNKVSKVGQGSPKKAQGIVPTDTHHSVNVYQVGNVYVVAAKVTGTAPWSYSIYKNEEDVINTPAAGRGDFYHSSTIKSKDELTEFLDKLREVA